MKRLLILSLFIFTVTCGISPAQEALPAKLITAARSQVGVTTTYDPAYVALKYPMGDLPRERGVCTDVVIRALRECGHDLQELVHLDMKKLRRLSEKLGSEEHRQKHRPSPRAESHDLLHPPRYETAHR